MKVQLRVQSNDGKETFADLSADLTKPFPYPFEQHADQLERHNRFVKEATRAFERLVRKLK